MFLVIVFVANVVPAFIAGTGIRGTRQRPEESILVSRLAIRLIIAQESVRHPSGQLLVISQQVSGSLTVSVDLSFQSFEPVKLLFRPYKIDE